MERVLDLTLKMADEGLSPDEQIELERLIDAEPLARRKHLQMLEVEAALRAAKHAPSTDALATAPSDSPLLERRVTAVLQTIRRPRLPRMRIRRAWVGAGLAVAAAAALLIVWSPGRRGPAGSQTGKPGQFGRLSSTRAARHETASGTGRGGWSTAVMAVQAAAPADHVSFELADNARLEVRGRAVLGIERAPNRADDGLANRVILDEGAVSYRRDGPDPLGTVVATPQANVRLQGGRAVISVSVEGTRLYLTEGQAEVISRGEERGTPVSARQTATVSARGAVAVTPLRSVLFVAGDRKVNVPPQFVDGVIIRRLETLGFAVETIDDHDLRGNQLPGRALLFISPSVSSAMHARIQELALSSASVPIICSRPMLFADLGMTGPGRNNAEFAERKRHVAITDEGHPLAAGFAGDVELLAENESLGWGIPAPGAARVAVFRDKSDRSAVFAYERDEAMVAGRAPARRVGFFLHVSAARFLHERAWKLFDAAVKWAADDAL